MKQLATLVLAFLSLSTSAWAGTFIARCPVSHFVRMQGTEIRVTSMSFRNGDPVNPATIDKITIYDVFGIPVFDEVAGNYPLNRDIPGGLDISTVPPNANYYLGTNHIWDTNSIPDLGDGHDGNSRGFNMTAVIQYSKRGDPKLFTVGVRARTRERLAAPSSFCPPNQQFCEGAERSSDVKRCPSTAAKDD